jgi:hypothetical protein
MAKKDLKKRIRERLGAQQAEYDETTRRLRERLARAQEPRRENS